MNDGWSAQLKMNEPCFDRVSPICSRLFKKTYSLIQFNDLLVASPSLSSKGKGTRHQIVSGYIHFCIISINLSFLHIHINELKYKKYGLSQDITWLFVISVRSCAWKSAYSLIHQSVSPPHCVTLCVCNTLPSTIKSCNVSAGCIIILTTSNPIPFQRISLAPWIYELLEATENASWVWPPVTSRCSRELGERGMMSLTGWGRREEQWSLQIYWKRLLGKK